MVVFVGYVVEDLYVVCVGGFGDVENGVVVVLEGVVEFCLFVELEEVRDFGLIVVDGFGDLVLSEVGCCVGLSGVDEYVM